jgi:cysteine desulfurase/selenocysteine lyase
MAENIDLKSRFDFFRKNNVVYLDSAATTQVPDNVAKTILQSLQYRGNPHRGAHFPAEQNKKKLEEARENISKFIGATSDEIVFTGNTTDSINLAVDAIADNIKNGDEIIIPISEHHSNILPFEKLLKKGAKLVVVNLKNNKLDSTDIIKAITKKTKIVAMNHVSNVLGGINPVEEIGKYLKHNHPEIIFIVDGAQAVAHISVDISKIGCDIYSFSGHKMYGPCGVGVLYISKRIFHLIKPVRVGGGTVKNVSYSKNGRYTDLVIDFEKGLIVLEGGTPNVSNILGLSEAVNFLRKIGFEYIKNHEIELTKHLVNSLNKINGMRIFGPEEIKEKTGVVSFAIKDISTKELGEYFDKRKICIRHGSHCAFPLIDYLGTETVRVSFGVYNDQNDTDTFLQELNLFLDKKKGLIKNPNLERLKNIRYHKNITMANSKPAIIQKILSSIIDRQNTEIFIMAGHCIGIPDVKTNTFYPSIKPLIPEHLHKLLDEFGMTSFPLYTWEFGCEIVKKLKEEGCKIKLIPVVNDTTGINELRTAPINQSDKKTAEQYRNQLLERFEEPQLPKLYLDLLKQYGLGLEDVVSDGSNKFMTEHILRERFKVFIEKNKEYFEQIIQYSGSNEGAKDWDLSINILDNQQIKTCRFDTFNSKTGGRFCIVEVCQLIAELFGKSPNFDFKYISDRVSKPKSEAKNKVFIMLSPAMCDDAITRGAELYVKLMLQEKGEGSFKFFNIPFGPDAERYLAIGTTIKYLSDKGALPEIDTDSDPNFPELWKLCEYNLLYNSEEYVNEMEELFRNLGLSKRSQYLDTCVGPGFFSTELLERGYNLATADKDEKMIKPFLESLKEKGIKHTVTMSDWLSLPKHFKKESVDMMFNRGNTFIYAAGGWNNDPVELDKKKAFKLFKKTLEVYYSLLKKGGYLYIDKFRDSEIPAEKVVAKLNIKSTKEVKEVIFSVERKPNEGIRHARMLLRDKNNKESGTRYVALDLTENELEDLLKETGFSEIKKLNLNNEKQFVSYLAKK